MKSMLGKRILAGLLSTVLLGTAVPMASVLSTQSVSPIVSAAEAEDGTTVMFATDFEDGVVDAFTGRGGVETIAATTDQAHSGSYSMCVSDRAKNWNGPQFLLDGLLEVGVEYTVSAFVRAAWYNSVKLSMEYTDASGERHYNNLSSVANDGSDWSEFSKIKFSIPENVTKVYLYFECNDQADIYVDDFEIRTAPVYKIQEDITSLKDAYADYFKVGTAVTASELAPQSAKDLILKHFNSVTLGNELKPDAILDQAATLATGSETDPQVNLASARSILDFCRDNNISVRGHVLVWHQQTPDWFFKEGFTDDGDWVTTEVMLQRLENYIKNVFTAVKEEYPTVDFYAWDVVNECWLDDGSYRPAGSQSDGSNNSPCVKIFGDNSFIEPAFEYARKYAPEGCKLYYNDFNEYMPGKTQAIYDMAMDLKEKGLIDGIGMQSHLDVRSGSDAFPSASVYKKALAKFAETGLDIQVTELDATVNDNTEAGFEAQAQYYSDIMDAIVEYKDSVSAVVFWGTTDDKSWRASRYPLLFNEDFTAKPAYYSIVDGLEVPVTTTTSTTTTTSETTTTTTNSQLDIIPGDVNGDRKLNGFDLSLMRQQLISFTTTTVVTDAEFTALDMTQDGMFGTPDAVALLRFLLNE